VRDPDFLRQLAWLITQSGGAGPVPPDRIPELLGAIEVVRAQLWSRLHSPAPSEAPAKGPSNPDRLLSAREAAERLGVKPKWMYAHAESLPFTKRLGERVIRFSEKGLLRWIEKKSAS